MTISRSIKNFCLMMLLTISSNAALVQSFEDNALEGSGAGLFGLMNSALYSPVLNSPCTNNTQMYAEGSWSVGSNANACHSLWAPTTGQGGAGTNFLIVNGSNLSNGRIYSQEVNTGGSTSGEFSGYFTGLFIDHAANLSMKVYDGTTFTLLGSSSFDTNLASGSFPPPTPTPAAWVKQSVSFTGATGSSILIEISLNNSAAGGDDFGVDTLDVAFALPSGDSPVPEPGTFLMGGFALAAIALTRNKRG